MNTRRLVASSGSRGESETHPSGYAAPKGLLINRNPYYPYRVTWQGVEEVAWNAE